MGLHIRAEADKLGYVLWIEIQDIEHLGGIQDGEQFNLGILSRGLTRKKTDLLRPCMTHRMRAGSTTYPPCVLGPAEVWYNKWVSNDSVDDDECMGQ